MSPITNLLHRPNEYRGVREDTNETSSVTTSTASTIRRPLVSALKKAKGEPSKKRKYLQRKVLFVEKSISWPPDGGTVEVGRSGTNLKQERLIVSDPERMVSARVSSVLRIESGLSN